MDVKRYINKLKQLATEYHGKRRFFNPFDAILFTIAPYIKCGNVRKHEAILASLSPLFNEILSKQPFFDKKQSEITEGGGENNLLSSGLPVWVLWFQGSEQMPKIVRVCLNSIVKNSGSHPVNFLHKGNITDFIQLPENIIRKVDEGKISFTHLSDIIRMGLLAKYGGYWIDATIFVSSTLSNYSDLSFYSIRKHKINNRFVSRGNDWSAYFIACGKENIIAKTIYDFFIAYWEKYDSMIDYFLIDYAITLAYRDIPKFRDAIQAIPYDNERVNDLRLNQNELFTEDVWNRLMSVKYSKLSWKQPPTGKPGTVGEKLLES